MLRVGGLAAVDDRRTFLDVEVGVPHRRHDRGVGGQALHLRDSDASSDRFGGEAVAPPPVRMETFERALGDD